MTKFYDKPHNEIIWRVDVSDEYLTFTVEDRPSDFMQKATGYDGEDLSGTYCGNRGLEDETFQLVRKLRAKDVYESGKQIPSKYQDKWGNFSLYEWRRAHGYGLYLGTVVIL